VLIGGGPLVRLGRWVRGWASAVDPWTNVYGLARTLLAVGSAATLAFSHSHTLFRAALQMPSAPFCQGPAKIGLFCLFPAGHLEIARWAAVAILLTVASGWRPRVTGIPHWWVSYSLHTSSSLTDGGDQVTSILTLLLLPLTLTDRRRWHWHRPLGAASRGIQEVKRLVALSALLMARVQVASVYFQAAYAKLSVEEWANGTALYYWMTDDSWGAPRWLLPVFVPLLSHGVTVALMTWGAVLLEIVLFMALTMPRRAWAYLLPLGIAFHAAIAVVHGLGSFALAMMGALILYLRPVENEFDLLGFLRRARPEGLGRPG
jgi:antimicrobial peptide system SdpB family protein